MIAEAMGAVMAEVMERTGNSHFLFQEMNNQVIADHVEAWLGEHGLN